MPSFYSFVKAELYRGYQLEHDEERFVARREKVYMFMKIPREVEKFMSYGFFQCTDAFLFLFTFLPVRFLMAVWALLTRPFIRLFRCVKINFPLLFNSYNNEAFIHSPNKARYLNKPTLLSSEIVDLLKGTIIIVCGIALSRLDMAMLYHLIKSQSVIKLYIFYNMLEVFITFYLYFTIKLFKIIPRLVTSYSQCLDKI